MRSAMRKIGNSAGFTVPKAMRRETGLVIGTVVDLTVNNGKLILTPVEDDPRAGWEEDAARIAAEPEDSDEAAWRGFGNEWDAEWTW